MEASVSFLNRKVTWNREVMHLWNQCKALPVRVVARESGRTTKELIAEFGRHGLLGNESRDPSPWEIAQMRLEIQESWDEATEKARWMAARTFAELV